MDKRLSLISIEIKGEDRTVYFQMSGHNSCTPLDQHHAKALLNNHDTFLFDCDGVIWNLPQTFPRAIELLNYLKEQVSPSSDPLILLALLSSLE